MIWFVIVGYLGVGFAIARLVTPIAVKSFGTEVDDRGLIGIFLVLCVVLWPVFLVITAMYAVAWFIGEYAVARHKDDEKVDRR